MSQSIQSRWLPGLAARIEQIEAAADELSAERETLLLRAADLISGSLQPTLPLALNFICTHNSRRSHLAQVWAAVAAYRYGVTRISALSGGTEATACNERVVRSLRRCGFSVVTETPTASNPLYLVQFAEGEEPVGLYSKRYDQALAPGTDFVAMMCCSEADEQCPLVRGAIGRVALHYRDPKESDGTAAENEVYDQRRDEIAAEMFRLLREIKFQ